MYISIKYLEDEIIRRGGTLVNNKEDVVKSYSMKGSFKEQKEISIDIISDIKPKYNSNEWSDNKRKVQKTFNFKYFKENRQIYFKRSNSINLVKIRDKDYNKTGQYIEKVIVDREHSYHELFVGLIINTLRSNLLKHFVFTFNFEDITITRRRIGKKRKVENTLSIYMEYVPNSMTFGDYIETSNINSFLVTYYNIALIIRDVYKEIGFIHYDLHTANILLQELKETEEFSYSDDERVVKSKRLVRIIDYGFSGVKYGGKFYKVGNNETLFLGEKDNPITDCFKLLLHSYKRLRNLKEEDEQDEEKEDKFDFDRTPFDIIFEFFCKENTIDEMLEFNQMNNYYNNIPKYYKESGIEKMNMFIKYLDENIFGD